MPTKLGDRAGEGIARWIKRPIWSDEDSGRALDSGTSGPGGPGVLGRQELNVEQIRVRMIDRLKNKFGK